MTRGVLDDTSDGTMGVGQLVRWPMECQTMFEVAGEVMEVSYILLT